MAIEITIPRLGWSMDEGTFAEWVKKDGDTVQAGDPIFSLETEKALQEVESVDAGILHILPDAPKVGDTVRVGKLIAYLLDEGEAPPEFQLTVETGLEIVQADIGIGDAGKTSDRSIPVADSHIVSSTAKVAASPSVRRLARELKVDLATLNLTGPISQHDVRRAAKEGIENRSPVAKLPFAEIPQRNSHPSLPGISPRAARTANRFNIDWTTLTGSGRNGRIREQDVMAVAGDLDIPDGEFISATPARRLIAERLAQSVRTTVPVTLTTVVRVDAIISDRARRKQLSGPEDVVPAIHDYVMLAVAKTLQEFPALNSRWMNGEILQPNGIHIGLAVDTQHGLNVPVVRDADQKSLSELAKDSTKLVSRAQDRKLTKTECAGGTFTISNLGSFGIDAFTPVINLGESAILGIGAVRKMPQCAPDETIVWIQQMTLSLTFDHQVVDGAPAAKFLQQLCSYIDQHALLETGWSLSSSLAESSSTASTSLR